MIEHHLVGHHRRLVGPGPARPALGYATDSKLTKGVGYFPTECYCAGNISTEFHNIIKLAIMSGITKNVQEIFLHMQEACFQHM